MITLQNDRLTVQLNPLGAELHSLYYHPAQLDYLWSGDPLYWGKKSPILFPIVGTLKNNTFIYRGKPYHLNRHGFAREQMFHIIHRDDQLASFTFASDEKTRLCYPFDFILQVNYHLNGSSLTVNYVVHNTGQEAMFFSLGGHPAFAVPLEKALAYEDYFLAFEAEEYAPRWRINAEGLLTEPDDLFLKQTNILSLKKSLFAEDALVFKHLNSSKVSLVSHSGQRGLKFDYTGFPYLGIWAAKNADFVCIEPWCGLADSVSANQQLDEKEGIIKLEPAEVWQRKWSVEVY